MSSRHHGKKSVKNHCKTCESHESACKCQLKAPKRSMKPLSSDCRIVDSVICSKEVQKVAEVDIPPSQFFFDLDATIDVTVDESRIDQNIVVIKDKIVNIGAVPVTITLDGTPIAIGSNVIFQEETDCPGACPGDTVTEAPLEVETVIIQRIPNAFFIGLLTAPVIRIKIILRTTVTVTRQVIVDKDGNICDLNDRRCETPTPKIIDLPIPPALPTGNGFSDVAGLRNLITNLMGNEDTSAPTTKPDD